MRFNYGVALLAGVLLGGCASQEAHRSEIRSTLATAEIIRLWPGDAPATQPTNFGDTGETMDTGGQTPSLNLRGITQPSISVFLPGNFGQNQQQPRTAMIICAGGGYAYESMAKEGFAVAGRLNTDGVVAFVLKYRLPNGVPPAADELPPPQQDVLRAVQLVRARAADWNVDPKRIGVMGFSAGGHLASSAATLYPEANLLKIIDAVSRTSARPDFAVLIYPVISMDPAVSHAGSRKNLIGEKPDDATTHRFSANEQVTNDTPPLFIAHAKDDRTVPLRNAELMDAAAARAGVAHELVIFEHGGHGFGLVGAPETRAWYDRCLQWMRSNRLLLTPAPSAADLAPAQ